MTKTKRRNHVKWSLMGAIGWQVWLPSKDGSGGRTFPIIAWAWRSDGDVRPVVCGSRGASILTNEEDAKAEYRQVRIV